MSSDNPRFIPHIARPLGAWTAPALAAGLAAACALLAPASAGAAASASAGPADAPAATARSAAVAGKVLTDARPLGAARVYLYRLTDLTLHKALTDERGGFSFEALPAGLYKIIAHKPGFVPAVVRLTRTTAEAYQFLELELAEQTRAEAVAGDDFWSLRAEVPPDVLREVQIAGIEDSARGFGAPMGVALPETDRPLELLAEMRAMTGVDHVPGSGDSQVTQGGVGIEGRLGGLKLGIEGDYWQLQPAAAVEDGPGARVAGSGEASALSVELANDEDVRVLLRSRSNRLVGVRDAEALSIDFEHYLLSVSHSIGENGRSDFSAQYTSESNFYRHGGIDPLEIPEASRSWRLEGTYTAALTERSSLQTGVRYREQQSAFARSLTGLPVPLAADQQQVDLFGRAGTQVRPSVLVEYGLYSALHDGSLSLSPRGGLVVQLAPAWQASLAASQKVQDDRPADDVRRFTSRLRNPLATEDACEQVDEACYQLAIRQQRGEDEGLSLAVSHRAVDETQRLYFSESLTDRYESLYLVPGDELPEIALALTRRITPKVLARFETHLAEGGGGVFYATDSEAYENSVRYLVASVDTHFDGTSTGLFLAFHHLQQDLTALDAEARPAPPVDVDRLELMLSQDLNVLLGMATDMALKLNMQLSRGSWAWSDEAGSEELRRRLLGGIALRF